MARLYLTGGLRLDGPEGRFTDADLPGQQGRVAFAILAMERRALSADVLADVVWDERPPERWKAALTPMLSKIRSLITSTGLDGHDVLQSASGAYRFVAPPDLAVDVEQALRRLDRAEGALRGGDHRAATVDATVAFSVLRRSFLAGIDNLWVERTRRHLADASHRCSITLAEAWHALGDQQLAATAAEAAIETDPLRETGYRLLIRAEQARRDRGAALLAYQRCVEALGELGVEPSEETRALAGPIRVEGPRS